MCGTELAYAVMGEQAEDLMQNPQTRALLGIQVRGPLSAYAIPGTKISYAAMDGWYCASVCCATGQISTRGCGTELVCAFQRAELGDRHVTTCGTERSSRDTGGRRTDPVDRDQACPACYGQGLPAIRLPLSLRPPVRDTVVSDADAVPLAVPLKQYRHGRSSTNAFHVMVLGLEAVPLEQYHCGLSSTNALHVA
eukprot:3043559-Rhodomonas_salina.3